MKSPGVKCLAIRVTENWYGEESAVEIMIRFPERWIEKHPECTGLQSIVGAYWAGGEEGYLVDKSVDKS